MKNKGRRPSSISVVVITKSMNRKTLTSEINPNQNFAKNCNLNETRTQNSNPLPPERPFDSQTQSLDEIRTGTRRNPGPNQH